MVAEFWRGPELRSWMRGNQCCFLLLPVALVALFVSGLTFFGGTGLVWKKS
jgi:hypothetical protein